MWCDEMTGEAQNSSLGWKWSAQDDKEAEKNKEKKKDNQRKKRLNKPYKHCKINMARNLSL